MQSKSFVPLLATVYAGAFMAGFNENLVNVALMSIMGDFAVDSVTAQWLVSGYMIVATVVVSCMAFLFRRVPLKALFFAATGLTLVGSVIGLVSTNFAMLMAARLIQAVGTGIFIPLMQNTILAVTPKNRLGVFMSIGGCTITFGPAFAPVVCGALVTCFGWHSVFVVPIVAMVVLIVMGFLFVLNLENTAAELDIPSVILSAVALTAIVYGMSQITIDLPMAAVWLLAGVAAGAFFVIRQKRCANPLINLSPFSEPRYAVPMALVFVAMMTMFSMSVLLPMYFEGAMGMTALMAGATMLVPVLANAGITLGSGRIMDRKGEWPLIPLGFAIVTVGVAALSITSATIVFPLVFVACLLVYGGIGLVFSPSQTTGLKFLTPEQGPHGVAGMGTCIQIAACIGPSLFTGILSSTQAGAIAEGVAAGQATASGLSAALVVAGVIAFVGFCLACVHIRNLRTMPALASVAPYGPTDLTSLMQKEPYTIKDTARVREAIIMLSDRKVSGVPVVGEDGKAIGFVSDGDIMRYLADKHPLVTGAYSVISMMKNGHFDEKFRELLELPIGSIATPRVISVSVDTPLSDVCGLLAKHKLKKVPVLDDGHVVGTINRSDILRYAMSSLVEEGTQA